MQTRWSWLASGSCSRRSANGLSIPSATLPVLSSLVQSLPVLGDVTIDGRPILAALDRDPAGLEAALIAAVRVAAANRNHTPESLDPKVRLRIRAGLRHLSQVYNAYEQEKSRLSLAIRRKDQAMERFLGPRSPAAPSSLSVHLPEMLSQETAILESKNHLVRLWTTFQSERLSFDRELGALPYDNWETFFRQFDCSRGPVAAPAAPPSDRAPAELAPGRSTSSARASMMVISLAFPAMIAQRPATTDPAALRRWD